MHWMSRKKRGQRPGLFVQPRGIARHRATYPSQSMAIGRSRRHWSRYTGCSVGLSHLSLPMCQMRAVDPSGRLPGNVSEGGQTPPDIPGARPVGGRVSATSLTPSLSSAGGKCTGRRSKPVSQLAQPTSQQPLRSESHQSQSGRHEPPGKSPRTTSRRPSRSRLGKHPQQQPPQPSRPITLREIC